MYQHVSGENLSKKQLQNSNTIKKLRVKEKENESLITGQKYDVFSMFLLIVSCYMIVLLNVVEDNALLCLLACL